MSGYRAYVEQLPEEPGQSLQLAKEEVHHLGRVRRIREGESLTLFDGSGRLGQGAWRSDGCIELLALSEVPRPPLAVTLQVALLKAKAMEEVLRTATVLGVEQIQPLLVERCEGKVEDFARKEARWHSLLVEAAKQSGQLRLPRVLAPCQLGDLQEGRDPWLLASLGEAAEPIARVWSRLERPTSLRLCVGPEGDFAPAEYARLRSAGVREVSLGASVLRAEVACFYALSVLDACSREMA